MDIINGSNSLKLLEEILWIAKSLVSKRIKKGIPAKIRFFATILIPPRNTRIIARIIAAIKIFMLRS